MSAIQQTRHLLKRAVNRFWHDLTKRDPWRPFSGAPGRHPEHTVRLFYALQDPGIRCRYRSYGPGAMGAMGASSGAATDLIIEVHRDDLQKAWEVAERINYH